MSVIGRTLDFGDEIRVSNLRTICSMFIQTLVVLGGLLLYVCLIIYAESPVINIVITN